MKGNGRLSVKDKLFLNAEKWCRLSKVICVLMQKISSKSIRNNMILTQENARLSVRGKVDFNAGKW